MNVGWMDGPSYIFAVPSQPHDFEIHLGVIFFCSVINIGIPLSQTVSTAGLKLPFVRIVSRLPRFVNPGRVSNEAHTTVA
jgi:hypothetical protein